MKIKKLQINNLRNIEVFESDFWNWNVIDGNNWAGKSTVIDAIFWAIKGKTYFDSDPFRLIKHEQDKAIVNLTLEGQNRDIIINRTFTKPTEKNPKGYDTLRLVDSTGKELTQKDLNAFFSSFTIDPLYIARQKPKEQIEILKEVAGIDVSDLEDKATDLYNQRTIENRELNKLKAVISEFWEIEEVSEVSVTDLIKERDKKQAENKELEDLEELIENKKQTNKEYLEKINEYKEKINNLEKAISNNAMDIEHWTEERKASKKHNLEEITEKINNAEENNKKARLFKEKKELENKYNIQNEVCENIDSKYKDTIKERADKIKNSKLPDFIDFDKSSGVLVNNIPFSQLNTAEQIKTAILLGSILTPELKVLHIKDGSLLDESTLKQVKEIAEKYDYQMLIEKVGENKESTITMREGIKI